MHATLIDERESTVARKQSFGRGLGRFAWSRTSDEPTRGEDDEQREVDDQNCHQHAEERSRVTRKEDNGEHREKGDAEEE
jgi:hypothetical protein